MARPSLPTVGGSTDSWGTELNSVLTDLRNQGDQWPPYIAATGMYVDSSPFLNTVSYNNAYCSPNEIHFVPMWIPRGGDSVDRIAVKVGVAAGAGKVARLGIYDADDTTFLPSDLIVDAGTVAIDSTGFKAITISETLAPTNAQGLVWLAMLNNDTGYAVAFTGIDAGTSTVMGSDNQAGIVAQIRSFTYGSLPDPAGTIDYGVNYGPAIWLRLS